MGNLFTFGSAIERERKITRAYDVDAFWRNLCVRPSDANRSLRSFYARKREERGFRVRAFVSVRNSRQYIWTKDREGKKKRKLPLSFWKKKELLRLSRHSGNLGFISARCRRINNDPHLSFSCCRDDIRARIYSMYLRPRAFYHQCWK